MTLLANGLNPDGWNAEDLIDVCDFLEYTGRTVKREEWVDSYIQAAAANTFRIWG